MEGVKVVVGVVAAVVVAVGLSMQVPFIKAWPSMGGFFLWLVLAPATLFVAVIGTIAVATLGCSPWLKILPGIYFFCAMAFSVCVYFLDNPRVKAAFFEGLHVSHQVGKPKPEPLVPPRMSGRTAGAEWAYSNDVTDEAVCERARNREFREGCAHVARRQKQ